MDDLDHKLLRLLQRNARLSVSMLAHQLQIARTTVQNRIARMEQKGIIKGYTVIIAEDSDIPQVRTVVLLRIEANFQAHNLKQIKNIPQIRRLTTTSGRFDLLLELHTTNTEQLDMILDQIAHIDGVKSTESLITLSDKMAISAGK